MTVLSPSVLSDAPPAADEVLRHLKKWLSTSESQISSLETLNGHLPKVKERMEGDMEKVTASFVDLTVALDAYAAGVNALMERVPVAERDESMCALFDNLNAKGDEISSSVTGIIVAMQFQDWVSQNLQIVMDVLKGNISYLRTEIGETIALLDAAHEVSPIDMVFARLLCEQLKLGELQQQYVRYLLDHGYIDDPSDLGVVLSLGGDASEGAAEDDDIELF